MFWVIFDTSTKPDYYRDVHNLLALPQGSTIRYDYGEHHLSELAVQEAEKGHARSRRALVAYAQSRTFRRGDPDLVGPIAYDQGLWIGTRIATLSHLRRSGNRYYFDLELLGYPRDAEAALGSILRALCEAREVPFVKWVSVSALDVHLHSLATCTACDNWSSVVNHIGSFPSQFQGDSFWRISKIARGARRSSIRPVLRDSVETDDGKEVKTGVEAVYQIHELARLGLQIESRIPEVSEEPRDPQAARTVAFQASPDDPLKDLDGTTLQLRRYLREWVEIEVSASDRINAQHCHLTMTTSPAEGDYPAGPEVTLCFRVNKAWWRKVLSGALAIGGIVSATAGAARVNDNLPLAIVLIAVGPILCVAAYYFWTGRIKLPGK